MNSLYRYFFSDREEASKDNAENDSSDTEDEDEPDDVPTDDISGDEFNPARTNFAGEPLTKGLRVFAKWLDGHFYPGIINSVNSDK